MYLPNRRLTILVSGGHECTAILVSLLQECRRTIQKGNRNNVSVFGGVWPKLLCHSLGIAIIGVVNTIEHTLLGLMCVGILAYGITLHLIEHVGFLGDKQLHVLTFINSIVYRL